MIKLRALTREDAELTWAWRNKEHIRFFFSGHPFLINKEKELRWIDSVLTSNFPHTYFGVEFSGELVGFTSLRNIDQLNRTAEFAILINVEDNGYGQMALEQTIDFAFNDLGLHRVQLKVMSKHEKAIGFYLKNGFKQEGVLRSSIFKRGYFEDQLIMAILEDDFLKTDTK